MSESVLCKTRSPTVYRCGAHLNSNIDSRAATITITAFSKLMNGINAALRGKGQITDKCLKCLAVSLWQLVQSENKKNKQKKKLILKRRTKNAASSLSKTHIHIQYPPQLESSFWGCTWLRRDGEGAACL